MPDRLRVIVGAYACSPLRGSECGVGWGWVRSLARFHDLWVLTGSEYRPEIESELKHDPDLGRSLRFQYIPHRRLRLIERVWDPTFLVTYANQWQRDAYRAALRLHAEHRFHLAHQLTYVGFRVPGHLWKLGVPFVWGPIGGLEQTPWALLGAMGWRGACVYAARNVWNEFDRRWAPLPRAAFRQAAALIAATRGIQSEIRRFYHRESEVISEIGEPPVSFSDISRRHQGEPLRLLWSGLHLPGKALPVLLRALAQTGDGVDWRLTVLGAGPLTPAWKRECHRLGLAARCNWLGQVKREEAVLQMRSAHVLAVSSLHDLTSTVVVEALCSALPVICPDLYGFRDAVTEECGFRVPATSVGALQAGMARSIVALHDDESLRRRMAAAALDRSRSYAWSWKADLVNTIYHTALQGRSC